MMAEYVQSIERPSAPAACCLPEDPNQANANDQCGNAAENQTEWERIECAEALFSSRPGCHAYEARDEEGDAGGDDHAYGHGQCQNESARFGAGRHGSAAFPPSKSKKDGSQHGGSRQYGCRNSEPRVHFGDATNDRCERDNQQQR
jgi:hypothetical protein